MKTLKMLPPGLFIFCLLLFNYSNGNAKPVKVPIDNLMTRAIPYPSKKLSNNLLYSNANVGCIKQVNVGDQLVRIIKNYQHQYVRDSWGIAAGTCFTDAGLQKFKDNRVTDHIIAHLRSDANFQRIIVAVHALPLQDRTSILDRASNTYRKTWAELGYDPETTSKKLLLTGQTDAGSEADKLIAEAVVSLF